VIGKEKEGMMLKPGNRICVGARALTALVIWGLGAGAQAADGVIEINQVKAEAGGVTAGDTPGFPVTISAAGSYILTSDLSVSDPESTAIDETVGGVAIDLNGFRVNGPVICTGIGPSLNCSPSGIGSGIVGLIGATVKNGAVGGFASNGISLSYGARVINVSSVGNGGNGIVVGNGIVRESYGSKNFGSGIVTEGSCVISRNNARINHGDGIVAGDYSNVNGNGAFYNVGFGLNAASSLVGYSENVFGNNNSGDANPQVNNGTDRGANLCGTRTTCP
jgi:hypothetical protein